jgi:hypothetical protein
LNKTKKSWSDNLTELELVVHEQKRNAEYFSHHKSVRVHAFGEEIDKILNSNISPGKSSRDSKEIMSSNSSRIIKGKSRKPLAEIGNILSPIAHLKKGRNNLEDAQISKRSREIPDTSYDDLMNKMRSPSKVETSNNEYVFPDHLRMSIPKNGGEWDPNLEEDESSESSEVEQIEKAMALLYRNGILAPVYFS